MSSKNNQKFNIKLVILDAFIMSGIHVKFSEILTVYIRMKVRFHHFLCLFICLVACFVLERVYIPLILTEVDLLLV